jgi:hypothetical protein
VTVRNTGLVFLLLLLPVVLFGLTVDVGGSIANETALDGNFSGTPTFLQKDKLALWLEMEFDEYWRFAIQGSYTFDITEPVYLDLDYLSIYRVGEVSFNAGRFPISEFTGLVLDHTLDGIRMRFALPAFSLQVAWATSALLQSRSSTILMSNSDMRDPFDETAFFAAPRMIEMFEFNFIEALLRQDIALTALLQQDMRPEEKKIAGGSAVHTQYLGVGMSGPLLPGLYHSIYFYLGTGVYSDVLIASFLTGGGLRLYLDEALYSVFELSTLLGTGDSETEAYFEGRTSGESGLFMPVSRPFFGLVFSPNVGNIWLSKVSYSFKPFAPLQLSVDGYLYFRTMRGPISEEALIDKTSEENYLGFEVDSRIGFRPLSDLGLALLFGVFVPNTRTTSPFIRSQRYIQYFGKFELSTSF